MLLAEDLLLLLTDDETGRLLVTGQYVDVALAGAQLVQLSLDRRVDVDDRKRLVVLDPSPTGDPLLDGALGGGRQRAGKKPSAVVGALGKGLRAQLYGGSTAAGMLRAEPGKVLGLFPRTTGRRRRPSTRPPYAAGLEGPWCTGSRRSRGPRRSSRCCTRCARRTRSWTRRSTAQAPRARPAGEGDRRGQLGLAGRPGGRRRDDGGGDGRGHGEHRRRRGARPDPSG